MGDAMNVRNEENIFNPLSDLIDDDIYQTLDSHGLINHKTLRDYQIKKAFKELRAVQFTTGDAIDKIRAEFPYLQFDTIRKIIYQPLK